MVVVTFPFSDLSSSKRRPALVLAALARGDLILCQITSRAVAAATSVPLSPEDFESGGLPRLSNIRPERLFTAHESIVRSTAGIVAPAKLDQVIDTLTQILRAP